jgi:hypothetical protein
LETLLIYITDPEITVTQQKIFYHISVLFRSVKLAYGLPNFNIRGRHYGIDLFLTGTMAYHPLVEFIPENSLRICLRLEHI